MNLILNQDTHVYTVDGVVFPGVTSVLEEMGLTPRYPAGPYRVRGHRVHQATVLFERGELDQYDIGADLMPYVERYKRLVADLKPEWSLIEEPMFHPSRCYAGTVDRYGRMLETNAVCDIKTGATGPETGLQLAAYTILIFPRGVPGSVSRYRFDLSEGDGRLVKYDDPQDFDAWLGILEHWKWLQRKKSRPLRST